MHSIEPLAQQPANHDGPQPVHLSRTELQVEHDQLAAQSSALQQYQPRLSTRSRPGSSTGTLVLLWLICGPLLAAGAVIAMITPALAPVFVVATVTVGMGVSAVQLTKHRDQRQPRATATDVQVSLHLRRQVRAEPGAGAVHLAESANSPFPLPLSKHTLGTRDQATDLGNTRTTLRRPPEQDRNNR